MTNMKIKKRGCYKLNRFPQFLCQSPNPLGENLGHDGISALIKRDTGELLLSLSLHYMRIQQEGGHLQTRKRPLIGLQICLHLDLGTSHPP